MAGTAKFLSGRQAARLLAIAMLTLWSAPTWAGGGIQASSLPDPEQGMPNNARAGAAPSAPAARGGGGSGHGVARPDRDLSKPIENVRRANDDGDPGGDGA